MEYKIQAFEECPLMGQELSVSDHFFASDLGYFYDVSRYSAKDADSAGWKIFCRGKIWDFLGLKAVVVEFH